MSLQDERREYRYGRLNRAGLHGSPATQFNRWLQQALDAGLSDATAMVLATVDAAGQPSQRTVLLKGLDDRGLQFFTHLTSAKARDIAVNARVSVLFPWLSMGRQVSVTATVTQLPVAEAEAYFHSRPRDSQLAAWASDQSQPVAARQVLDDEFAAMQETYAGREIPMPADWGGYCLAPSCWEFWQGGENRLHDRFRYTPAAAGSWQITRLAP